MSKHSPRERRPFQIFRTNVFPDMRLIGLLLFVYSTIFLVQLQFSTNLLHDAGPVPKWPDPDEALSLRRWVILGGKPWLFRIVGPIFMGSLYRVLALLGTKPSLESFYAASSLILSSTNVILSFLYFKYFLSLKNRTAVFGVILYMMAFPVFFAQFWPTMTRVDDFLAYSFLLIGLMLLHSKRYWLFTFVIAVSVLTRETTLVLLFVVWNINSLDFRKKVMLSLVPIFAFLSIRLVVMVIGNPSSSYLAVGWRINREYFSQSVMFLFASFGVLWASFAVGWFKIRREYLAANSNRELLWRSAPLSVGTIVFTACTLAVIRETRILFLAFPWIIGITIMFVEDRNLLNNRPLRVLLFVVVLSVLITTALIAFDVCDALYWIPGVEIMSNANPERVIGDLQSAHYALNLLIVAGGTMAFGVGRLTRQNMAENAA